MFLSFSEFVTYPVMSSDLPALKKTHLKSTVHGDGNILYSSLLLFCRTARSVSVTVPLTAFVSLAFPLSLSCYDFTAVQEKKKNHTLSSLVSGEKKVLFSIVASFVTVIEEMSNFSILVGFS